MIAILIKSTLIQMYCTMSLGLTSVASSCHKIPSRRNSRTSHYQTTEPPLPAKKRSRGGLISQQQMHMKIISTCPSRPVKDCNSFPTEAIYDCLPKPRPCLSDRQIRFNEIYDEPRRLFPSRYDFI